MDQCWAPGLPIVCCNDGLTGRRSSLLHPQRGICRSYAHSCDPDVPGSLCNIWWCLSTLAGAICHFLLPKWKKLFLVDNLFIENSVPWIGTIKNHLPVGTGFFLKIMRAFQLGRASLADVQISGWSDQALDWTFLSTDVLTFVHNPMVDHNSLLKLH